MSMINQKHCPVCGSAALRACKHLALAAEGRDFVRLCIELCQGQRQWLALLEQRRQGRRGLGEWPPEAEDYTWLETAFCSEFLQRLPWFSGLDHEWRTGPKTSDGSFWVLLWSKDPQKLWWQLRDEFERQTHDIMTPKAGRPAVNGKANPGQTFAHL